MNATTEQKINSTNLATDKDSNISANPANVANLANNQPPSANIGQFLAQQKNQIQAALPKHMTPERMLRIAMTEIRKTPKLKICTHSSLIGAIIQCSQLGLEPGGALGHAYLIPYYNKKKGVTECQFVLGYRGMIDLVRRSGQVVTLAAHVVYENDVFEFEYGLNEKLRHIPIRQDKGNLMGGYAVAHLKAGGHQIEFMWKEEIDSIRQDSEEGQYSPWGTHYEEMAKKTVIRRLFKYLPVSIEIQRAVVLDESAERGEQENGYVIDGEVEVTGLGQSKRDSASGSGASKAPISKADAVAQRL